MSEETSLAPTGRLIVESVLAFLSDQFEGERAPLRHDLERLLTDAGEDKINGLVERLNSTGAEFTYYPRNSLARDINGVVAEYTLAQGSGLAGVEHLPALAGKPVVFLPNHLSYSDANLLEVLLVRAGFADVAARLTVIAGPKVYSDTMRRFSSLCFGTIKTPQPTGRSSAEAVMSVREVARLARDALRAAEERKNSGDALLVFVEGTRSRTASMQRALPAIVRYFEAPGVLVVPVGISGTERLVPLGEERAHLAPADAIIGRPVASEVLAAACDDNRKLMMDVVGVAIARLLPPSYQGVYAADAPDLDDARRIATDVFG